MNLSPSTCLFIGFRASIHFPPILFITLGIKIKPFWWKYLIDSVKIFNDQTMITCKHSEEGKPVCGRTVSWPRRLKVYPIPVRDPGFFLLCSGLQRNYIFRIPDITQSDHLSASNFVGINSTYFPHYRDLLQNSVIFHLSMNFWLFCPPSKDRDLRWTKEQW